MFDMSSLVKRYFPITLEDGRKLEIEPPKLKTLKKIAHLSKITNGEEDVMLITDNGTIIRLKVNSTSFKIN